MKELVLLAVAACGDGVMTSSIEQLSCPLAVCGLNSRETAHYGMHEGSLLGAPDDHGINFRSVNERAQIYQGTTAYDLDVNKSRIRGIHSWLPPLEGQALVGAEMIVEYRGQPLFNIHIDRVREITFAVGPTDFLESYAMTWHEHEMPPTPDQPLCSGPLTIDPHDKRAYPQLLDMLPDETLFFEADGERYDVNGKTLVPAPVGEWFNIGCAGHTLAKLHLLRQSKVADESRDEKGRQAAFKMLVADYCGKGTPYTVSGEPLVWKGGVLTDYLLPPAGLEARWTENGALCLGKVRLLETDSPDAPVLFPDPIEDMIGAECSVPYCANTDPNDLDGALRVSANPPIP
jgi:hypothetical protein